MATTIGQIFLVLFRDPILKLSVEDVAAVNDKTFFQMYWWGDKDTLVQRMNRAREAGAKGLIVTRDWSFSNGRDWGSP